MKKRSGDPILVIRTVEGSANARRTPVNREKVLAEFKRLEERGILPPLRSGRPKTA